MSIKFLKYHGNFIFLFITLALISACRSPNIGGVGWDEKKDIEEAKRYPLTKSNRILVKTEEVPFNTFKQESNAVFKDFPYSGDPISSSSFENTKTNISETPYTVSYENNILKILRDDVPISERQLPRVFYMHPISSGATLGNSRAEDLILCRTISRATTGLHYILIIDGNGEILFEKILGAAEDWDILPGNNGDIIIGGARAKTTISQRK